MGSWSFYFLAKLGLYAAGLIGLNWWLNALFALALLWQPPAQLRRWRHWLAFPAAVALLWHDSHWPSPWRAVEEWRALAGFSAGYVGELIQRVVSWQVVGALLLGAGLHAVLSRRLRLGAVALVALLAVPLLPTPRLGEAGEAVPMEEVARRAMQAASEPEAALAATPAAPPDGVPAPAVRSAELQGPELDRLLANFYSTEREKAVALPRAGEARRDFDLVFLSVCSLSWDDIVNAGLSGSPFLKRFDLVFRQFNSAASYSGPAVLRLLHGSCGQGAQHTLYEASPPNCYLFRRLEEAGYESALLLNHDGHFDRFADQLRQQGAMGLKPLDNGGAPVAMHSFDGSPIYGDYELLARWWRAQPKGNASGKGEHRALLYNTISLHDGNRVPGYGSQSSTQTWRPRAEKLFADFDRFFALVEQSGRPTVVVLIPEHGAAIHGDALQIPGLREYPTPRITHVPAAVALLGFDGKPAGQQPVYVDQVTSYTSLVGVIATLMNSQGASAWSDLATVASAIPAMQWVAENDKTVVMREGGHLYVRSSDAQWSRYPADR